MTFHSLRLTYDLNNEEDVEYAEALIATLGDRVIGRTGDQAPHEAPAEVLVVLVGEHTWRDDAVAAELAYALEVCGDPERPRCGVMGVLLPCYDYPGLSRRQPHGLENLHATVPRDGRYWACNVPRILFDNLQTGLVVMRPYTKTLADLEAWAHSAVGAPGRKLVAPSRPTERYAEEDLGWPLQPLAGVVDGAVNLGTP